MKRRLIQFRGSAVPAYFLNQVALKNSSRLVLMTFTRFQREWMTVRLIKRFSPGTAGLLIVAFGFVGNADGTAPFVPLSDDQVVARIRISGPSSVEREVRHLRIELEKDPSQWETAEQLVSKLIQLARRESDPRYLGQAQTALAPWFSQTQPPVQALVLRAIVRQSLHDFSGALSDLDAALARDHRNLQAWLVRSTILTVRGEFEQARRACLPVMQLADTLTAVTAAASISSLTGGANRSIEILEEALKKSDNGPAGSRIWAQTLIAETLTRLGRADDAERQFREALILDPRDPYLLGSYSDFLLDQHQPAAVAELLHGLNRMDSLLLRLAEAHSMMPSTTALARIEIDELNSKFTTGRARGDRVHLREEARFHLRLLGKSASALRLARENWDIQKEPADARILLECARAEKDADSEKSLLEWVRSNHLEDVHLTADFPTNSP